MAVQPGFEPELAGPQPTVLPLHHSHHVPHAGVGEEIRTPTLWLEARRAAVDTTPTRSCFRGFQSHPLTDIQFVMCWSQDRVTLPEAGGL